MIDRTLKSRYECKYLLTPRQVELIRAAIRPFVQPDRHARRCPGYRYSISSLYLDTPELTLYQQGLNGLKNRLKLRVRTYGDGEQEPVFFEVKKRMSGIVSKFRARVERRRALPILDYVVGRGRDALMPDLHRVGEFSMHARRLGVVPVARVRYDREAYESVGSDPVRVTFDTALSHALNTDTSLSHAEGDWHETPIAGVILEIKFTDVFPSWVADLVQRFQLDRCSVSKYNHALVGIGDPTLGLQRLLRRIG